MARDVDIGESPRHSIDVNVLVATPVVEALGNVMSKIDETMAELSRIRLASELILGQEVEPE